ncbi:muscarinic acetylcholine receptor DM1 [Eurytemora carolleeae]|uniref:muscarinic acetylcholine receptor DM1 n=1 Tax=Eurytemora carolleeae TaxID=1294199 RepID=UPI000C779122|nr:muscarinic acetylcholine receptor DM1 [Eurytemora carolleeae]|eukprot:XP_023328083.1 muscarinic acetylcholine receptor DM1-like [Eurytemora affinis]
MQEWKDIWEKENYVRIPIRVGNLTWPTNSTPIEEEQIQVYSSFQVVAIAVISGFFSFLTILGNIMVMISFKLDKQLQTISNYFLFSLAVADFTIGVFSMPMFTVYTVVGFWPFEPFVCDTWLAVDYLVSNASVMNLLIISFDRYFSVTRPLSYRARRTTRKAATMITSAWVLSLIIWVPWIYAWPYIEGIERTVEEKAECVVQFLDKNIALNVLCAMAAFFLPATIMCGLYLRVWWETVKRQRDLVHLQAGKKMSSKRSDSSEEYGDSKIQDLSGLTLVKTGNTFLLNGEQSRRSRIPLPIQNIISRIRREETQETREVIPLNPPDTVTNPVPAPIDGSAPRQYYPQENGCAGDVYTILI